MVIIQRLKLILILIFCLFGKKMSSLELEKSIHTTQSESQTHNIPEIDVLEESAASELKGTINGIFQKARLILFPWPLPFDDSHIRECT